MVQSVICTHAYQIFTLKKILLTFLKVKRTIVVNPTTIRSRQPSKVDKGETGVCTWTRPVKTCRTTDHQ